MEIKDLRTVSQVQHPPPPPPPGPMLTSHAPMRHTSQLPQQRALSPAKHK